MDIAKVAERIGARLWTPGPGSSIVVDRVYAGDRMSDLLNAVTDTTLLVTNLSNSTLVRFIELMDAPAVCLLHGVEPEEAIVSAAHAHGAVLMVSPVDMFETCGRLYEVLRGGAASTP